MTDSPRPSDFLAPGKVAAAMRAQSAEQDRRDDENHWPKIETYARHNAEARWRPDNMAGNDDEPDGLELIDWPALAAVPVPPREWIVRDWILPRAVTLIAGSGGTGKSLLVQQWLTSIATGCAFLGVRPVAAVPTLFVNCEDDTDELHRRQHDICMAFGRSLYSLQNLHTLPRVGLENALGHFDDRGRFIAGDLFHAIRDHAQRHGIRVIALDNVAHLFTGNENDRQAVTPFVNALARLALEIDGAVILVGHPANSQGSEFSGSTAWEAAVRMRLFLARETDDDGDEVNGSDRRILSRNKANYAAKGERLEMVWRAGAFHPDSEGGNSREPDDETAFLACLDMATDARRNVSHLPGSNYAPNHFARMPEAGKRSAKALATAMERLINRRVIEVDRELWKGSNRHPKSGLKRAEMCANPPTQPIENIAPTPAPTPCADPRQPPSQVIENIAPTLRAPTPLLLRNIGAGPEGPPPLTEDEWAEQQAEDDAVAAELGWEADS